ncbi:hypothetical protein HDV06_004343 [Boothiomyces sp. JEL0866]|nr:hypothetical protein HDV06_004343 [Boothiomyces sp. JEL0866]
MSFQDFKLIFLGTSSAQPSTTRNQSSLALKVNAEYWIFDCGEGTQHQLIRQPTNIKMGKIKRIFITHLHGDHAFGLPGLICTVYGPSGTRAFIRDALRSTYCRLGVHYVVHELLEGSDKEQKQEELHPEELEGQDILKKNNFWEIDEFVKAGSIAHTVPTIGYVVTEPNSKGKLRMKELQPLLIKHKQDFLNMGISNPNLLLNDFKNGKPIEIPEIIKIHPQDYIDPDVQGRKVVVLGDCNNADEMIELSRGCNVLVHEATNAFLKGDEGTRESVKESTISHGHSTPEMAGSFAKLVNAKHLILNHFSSRYKGDLSDESISVMNEIRLLAVNEFNEKVYCAYDYYTFEIPK